MIDSFIPFFNTCVPLRSGTYSPEQLLCTRSCFGSQRTSDDICDVVKDYAGGCTAMS